MEEQKTLSLAKAFTEMAKILNHVQTQLLSVSQAMLALGEKIDEQFDLRVEEAVTARLAKAIPLDAATILCDTNHTESEVC